MFYVALFATGLAGLLAIMLADARRDLHEMEQLNQRQAEMIVLLRKRCSLLIRERNGRWDTQQDVLRRLADGIVTIRPKGRR